MCMTNVGQCIVEFLEDKLRYINRNGISITLVNEKEVSVSAYWFGRFDQPGISLELIYTSKTIEEFIETCGVSSIQQLDLISLSLLLKLYHDGKSEIYGAIDTYEVYYPLSFKKQNGKLFAITDEDIFYELIIELNKPEQFVRYIQDHFEFITKPLQENLN